MPYAIKNIKNVKEFTWNRINSCSPVKIAFSEKSMLVRDSDTNSRLESWHEKAGPYQ